MTIGILIAALLLIAPAVTAAIGISRRDPAQWWTAWAVLAVLCVAVDAVVISQLVAG